MVWYDFSNKTPPILCCCSATNWLFKVPSNGYACELQVRAPPRDQTTSKKMPHYDEYLKDWNYNHHNTRSNLKVRHTTPRDYHGKPAGVIYKKVFPFQANLNAIGQARSMIIMPWRHFPVVQCAIFSTLNGKHNKWVLLANINKYSLLLVSIVESAELLFQHPTPLPHLLSSVLASTRIGESS